MLENNEFNDIDIEKEIILCEYIVWFYDECNHCKKFDFNIIQTLFFTIVSMLDDKSDIIDIIYTNVFDSPKSYYTESVNDIIIDELIKLNIMISEDDFNTICCYQHIKLIEYALDNKIIPTQDNFNDLLCGKDRENIIECIYLFLEHGYNLLYEDFLSVLRKRIEIKNFEKYNFVLDTKFIITCADFNFYPSYYNKIKLTHNDIEELLKIDYINLTSMKPFLNSTLPISCLEIACSTGNLSIIKYLINKCKLTPNKTCLLNVLNSQAKKTIKFVVESYVKLNEL
jgi:hypothetical protein